MEPVLRFSGDTMTCYFRHMGDVFGRAGIEVTQENKKTLDRVIHDYVGIEYKDCSATWRRVKERLAEDEESFLEMLRGATV